MYARFAQWAMRTYPPLGGASVLRQSIAVPPDVGRNGDTLTQDGRATQGWIGSHRPLRKTCVHLATRLEKADRLPSSRQQLLKEDRAPEACNPVDRMTGFSLSDDELRSHPCSAVSIPQPRLARFDHGGQPNFFHRHQNIANISNDRLARHT